MAYDSEMGQSSLRKTFVDGIVKQTAIREYKFKQALTISSTGAWTNIFYREDPTVPSAQGAGNTVGGLPRGAAFPQATPVWEKITTLIVKYGLESNIHYEDIISNEIDTQSRVLIKIGQGVAKAVDDQILADLSENAATVAGTAVSRIQTMTAGAKWDSSSAAIIDDLANSSMLIAQNNYDVSNLITFINPKQKRYLLTYLAGKGAQFPSLGTEAAVNGRFGNIAGHTLVVSNSVPSSYALTVVPGVCGSWKELVPFQTDITVDPFKSTRIRAVEMGTTQIHNPLAIVLITGIFAT